MIWLTTVLTSTESYGYVNLTESMRRKRSVRGALVTEGGYEKADTRVGHWNGQRGRGMIVRGPEPRTSHPRGRTVCFVETAKSMGGPSGPCQRYSLPLRQGSLPCEERWHLLAEDGTSEVADVSAPVTPMSSELTRIEVSESRRDQIRRGWATRQRVHVEGEASQFRWLRAPATTEIAREAETQASDVAGRLRLGGRPLATQKT